jgi:hypothetical protein
MTPTMFRQIFFSDVPEGQFFRHLYDRGYLLDQRRTRADEHGLLTKDGYRHGHPGHKGDKFFQLPENPFWDSSGRPRARAIVRPDRVHDLVEVLIAEGLTHNRSISRPTPQVALEPSIPAHMAIAWEGPPPVDYELYRNRSA